MSVDNSNADARVRIRLALLSATAILFALAFLAYAFSGIQWAIAPFTLGVLSLLVALGRMTERSLSLFLSDLRGVFADVEQVPQSAQDERNDENMPASHAGVQDASAPQDTAGNSSAVSADVLIQDSEDTEAHKGGHSVSILGLSERRIGVGLFAAGLMFAALSLYKFPGGPPNTLAWWSFALSVLLTLGAAPAMEGGWSSFIARFKPGYRITIEPRTLLPWVALGGILAVALLIRVYNLDGLPPGLWFDEADLIEEAMRIADNPGSTPVFVAFQNLPSLMSVLTAIQFELNGVSISSARVVAAVFGAAGCAVMFLLVRHMLGTAMGLVAAFLTAVTRWDIIWSRVALHGITLPFFAALSAWLTYRAIRGKRAIDYALAGTALGLGAWFYSPFRMFPIVIGFVLLHALLFSEAERRRRLLANIGVLILFALIVAAPVVQVAVVFPEEFFRRTGVVFVGNFVQEGELLATLTENLKRHLLMFHFEGDPNGRHNIPGAPMLDVISGFLMLAGLVIAVFRWRRAAFIALPVWLLVMIIPGVLTIPWEAPQSLRSITVIPAVIALITIAVDFVWKLGRSSSLRLVRIATATAIGAALIAIAYTNINTYFNVQASHPEVYAAFSTDEKLIADDMSDQAPRGYSPMVSRQFRHSLVASLFGHRFPRQTISAPTNIPLDPAQVWRGAAIYLEPRESGFYDALRAYYPSADFREVRPPVGGDVLYYSAYISREQLEAAQGLAERRTMADGEVVEGVKRDTESVWMLEASGEDMPFDVEWTGTLHITHAGEYDFALESDSPATVTLDGTVILNEDRTRVKVVPSVGLHALEVKARVEGTDGALRLLWIQPPLEEGEQTSGDEEAKKRALEPIPAGNLYHGDVRPLGLAGRFFKDMEDATEIGDVSPDAMQITPGIGGAFWYNSVVEGAHLAVWDGTLNVPESGLHRFRFGEVHGEMRLNVDGETVIDTRASRESEVELAAGRHRIRLEYQTSAGSPWFEALWTPPGQGESRIAPEYLSPDAEYMFRVVDGE